MNGYSLLSGRGQWLRRSAGHARRCHLLATIDAGASPTTVSALEMAFFGALVQAGSGEFTYHEIADRLTYVVRLILAGAGETNQETTRE